MLWNLLSPFFKSQAQIKLYILLLISTLYNMNKFLSATNQPSFFFGKIKYVLQIILEINHCSWC